MWKFLSENNLGNLFEKLIDKQLTRKEQVNELEELWKFLSENNLKDLFERLVDKKIITIESLLKISKDTIHNYNVGLEYAEEERLLSALVTH